MPALEILSGKHSGNVYDFPQTAKIGKDETCEVRLTDPGVSRFHAQIIAQSGQASIEDTGSSNGTYVNFKKRSKGEKTTLSDADIVFFGRTVCKFHMGSAPARGGGGGGGAASIELLRSTVPIAGLPNQAQLQAQVREAEQVEVIRRLRLHELDDATLGRLLQAAR